MTFVTRFELKNNIKNIYKSYYGNTQVIKLMNFKKGEVGKILEFT